MENDEIKFYIKKINDKFDTKMKKKITKFLPDEFKKDLEFCNSFDLKYFSNDICFYYKNFYIEILSHRLFTKNSDLSLSKNYHFEEEHIKIKILKPKGPFKKLDNPQKPHEWIAYYILKNKEAFFI